MDRHRSCGAAMNKRMKASLIGGALLGIFCVAGAYVRSALPLHLNLLSLWYNRVNPRSGHRCSMTDTVRKKGFASWCLVWVFGFICSLQLYRFSRTFNFCSRVFYGVILKDGSADLRSSCKCKTIMGQAVFTINRKHIIVLRTVGVKTGGPIRSVPSKYVLLPNDRSEDSNRIWSSKVSI